MENKIVYSTDPEFCAVCGRTPCGCAEKITRKQPEPVRLVFSRVSRGAGMTRIERLNLHPRLKEHLLKDFKKRFGCGGTIKDGVLELQGDRRDPVEAQLKKEGYKVKRVGG